MLPVSAEVVPKYRIEATYVMNHLMYKSLRYRKGERMLTEQELLDYINTCWGLCVHITKVLVKQ